MRRLDVVPFGVIDEDALNVRVAAEADVRDHSEDAFHLRLVVDVLGEDILADWIACGASGTAEPIPLFQRCGSSARNAWRRLRAFLSSLAESRRCLVQNSAFVVGTLESSGMYIVL